MGQAPTLVSPPKKPNGYTAPPLLCSGIPHTMGQAHLKDQQYDGLRLPQGDAFGGNHQGNPGE